MFSKTNEQQAKYALLEHFTKSSKQNTLTTKFKSNNSATGITSMDLALVALLLTGMGIYLLWKYVLNLLKDSNKDI